MKVLATLALALAPALSAQVVYVGAYTNVPDSKGIVAYRFDASTGKLAPLGLMAETSSPSFLAISPNGKFLYAVNELNRFNGKPTGAVSAFSIDRATNKLTLLNQVESKGTGPCHIAIDPTGKVALVANYNSGTFASFPIMADGKLGEAASVIQDVGSGPNRARQAGPHAHEMVITDKLVLGADLGLDHVQLFHLNAAKATLTPATPPFAALQPGFGPRHMVISRDRKYIYVVSEMKSQVDVMEYDPVKGPGKIIATVSNLPDDFKGTPAGAEIMLDKKGHTLYTSDRGNNSIAVFSVNAKTGMLTRTGIVSSGGKTPRYFTLDPTGKYLLATNQDSNNITVFKVDQNTGALTPTGDSLKTGAPVDLVFLK